jgi:hypothetical protein
MACVCGIFQTAIEKNGGKQQLNNDKSNGGNKTIVKTIGIRMNGLLLFTTLLYFSSLEEPKKFSRDKTHVTKN